MQIFVTQCNSACDGLICLYTWCAHSVKMTPQRRPQVSWLHFYLIPHKFGKVFMRCCIFDAPVLQIPPASQLKCKLSLWSTGDVMKLEMNFNDIMIDAVFIYSGRVQIRISWCSIHTFIRHDLFAGIKVHDLINSQIDKSFSDWKLSKCHEYVMTFNVNSL